MNTNDNQDRDVPVTIGITNYNGENTICKTIESLLNLNYKNFKIIIVDDASTDNSVEVISDKFPNIDIIRLKENKGLSAVRNQIIKNSETNLIFIVDNDITLDFSCLKILVKELLKKKDAVVVTPRILNGDGKSIYSDGTKMHYIGAAIHYNKNVPLESVLDQDTVLKVESGSGGMMLINKGMAEKIGFFDEDFRFGWTDGEFMFRATLNGMKCYNVTKALVYHPHKTWGTGRAYYQLRNRWYIILSTYSLRTLIAVAPMLFFYECFLAFFMLKKGNINDYAKSWIMIIKNIRTILNKRKIIQSRKVISDREFLNKGSITVDSGLVKNKILFNLVNYVNQLLDLYWVFILKLGFIEKGNQRI